MAAANEHAVSSPPLVHTDDATRENAPSPRRRDRARAADKNLGGVRRIEFRFRGWSNRGHGTMTTACTAEARTPA